ncbi:MAG: hypothetical protein EOL98_11205 [Negativicutes bacterium]|nr:hypothetical protein [Negativicutes bacterium]
MLAFCLLRKDNYKIMFTQTKVTMLGVFAGFAIVALASSGACNHAVSHKCLTGACAALSPNCTGNGTYRGYTTNATDKISIAGGGPGYTVWINGPSTCTYECQITEPDCCGETPRVKKGGGYNMIPAGGFIECQ